MDTSKKIEHFACIKKEKFLSSSLFFANRGMERFSQILENTMKMKSEMTGEASSKVITEFLSEQQVCMFQPLPNVINNIF